MKSRTRASTITPPTTGEPLLLDQGRFPAAHRDRRRGRRGRRRDGRPRGALSQSRDRRRAPAKNCSACRSRSSSAATAHRSTTSTEVCYTLGRACASTAMIFAMHQTKVACLVRHGRGNPWHRSADAPHRRRAAAAGVLDHRGPERRQHPLQRCRRRPRATPDLAGPRRHRDLLRRRGRRPRHHRPPRRRRRRLRPGAAGAGQGRLHAGAHHRAGTRSACAAPAAPASS